MSRGSAVGMATGYGMDDRGFRVRVPVMSRIFTSPYRPGRLWGPPSLILNEYRGFFFRGVKSPGREAYQSPPTSAKVNKTWIYTPTPHTSSCCSV
jgi:hypothetical protein